MRMENNLIPTLLSQAKSLVPLADMVPVQRPQCKMLAELVTGLIPLLQEIRRSNVRLTDHAIATFKTLKVALDNAENVLVEMKKFSKLKLFFRSTTLTVQLSEATCEIQGCLINLPLMQLRISAEMQDTINQLNLDLGELGKELKDTSSMQKDHHDLKAEVMEVLRAHNSSDSSSFGGGTKVMDKLMSWLAKRFDSDVDTVRSEWEEMKDDVILLRDQVEFTSENKRQLEEELLQTMLYISQTEENKCITCASQESREYTRTPLYIKVESPREFQCPICYEQLEDPVITGSGFTYCRKCITNWFKESDTCPLTGSKLVSKNLIANIALRNLIARWWTEKSQMESRVMSSVVGYDPNSARSGHGKQVFEYTPNTARSEDGQQVLERSVSGSNLQSPASRSPIKSVATYISLLSSTKSMQILKSLKELTSIANSPEGQVQVYEEGGIPEITRLLKGKDTSIAEKAAGALDALTFEIKDNNGDPTLAFQLRDQICSSVTEIALGDLIDLMLSGSKTTCLKAAQTVINVLADEEIREHVIRQIGVVRAFYRLISIGEGFLFTDEGKSLCIKGLNLLSGEKSTGSTDVALTIALLRLAALGASPSVIEESLSALRSLVEVGGESICSTMHTNNAIPFLVRSISCLPSDSGREDALKILNEMAQLDGMREVIVKNELFYHLLPVLNDATHGGDCLNEATRLLSTCLSFVRGDISLLLSQADMKGFIGLLGLERTSVACKMDILSSLQYLCRESLSLRMAFLNSAGVATMLVLVKSFKMSAIKDGVAQLLTILASFPSCRKEICNQGGIEIFNFLLSEENLECWPLAVVAAESLLSGPEGVIISMDGFPSESVVDLLGPIHDLECRAAAAGICSVLASNSELKMVWDRKVLDLLLNMVRPCYNLPMSARKKAAETLITIVRHDSSVCPHFVEEDGLQVLINTGLSLGTESRAMIIQLLSVFCKEDSLCKQAVVAVGGTKILLEALDKGRMKEESAAALGHLLESISVRKAVLQAGFIECSIRCMQSNGGNQCSVELARALVLTVDKDNAVNVRKSGAIQALLSVLELGNDTGKIAAAIAITKLIRLDPESSILLGETGGISSLCKFSVFQKSEASQPLEVLEALSAASEELNNKILIVEEGAIPGLISLLIRGAPRVQELTLLILLHLSREGASPVERDICGTLISKNISNHLFDIVKPQSELSGTETTVYCAICIIRNLSLSGVTARTALMEEGEGAIKVLLDRIRYYEANASAEIVRGAVIALERFMLNSRGRMALIREGGIKVIVSVLHHRVGSGQAKSFATKILVMMAQDAQASREVCHAIFEANVIPRLRDIFELGPSGECRLQACLLLKFLMYVGPRVAVCRQIREEQCIPKLLDLRSDIVCHEAATSTLDLLKTYDRDSREQITEADQHHIWSRALVS